MDTHRIDGIAESFIKGHGFISEFTIRIFGSPGLDQMKIALTGHDGIESVEYFGAGRDPLDGNRGSIYKGFESGTDLSPIEHVVVLKMLKIHTPNPGFYVSRSGFDGQYTGLENHPMIFDGIHWTHHRICLHSVIVRKNGHGDFLLKYFGRLFL